MSSILLDCAPGRAVLIQKPRERDGYTGGCRALSQWPERHTSCRVCALVDDRRHQSCSAAPPQRLATAPGTRGDCRRAFWRFIGVPLLDPIQNMGIKDEKFKELVKVFSSFTQTRVVRFFEFECVRKSLR